MCVIFLLVKDYMHWITLTGQIVVEVGDVNLAPLNTVMLVFYRSILLLDSCSCFFADRSLRLV